MDLVTHMQTFVRIVEAGSFSAASKQLRLSVAAVSRHVSALEDELGTSLLARTTRKTTLTPAGRTYYEACLRVLSEVEDAQSIGRVGVAGPLRMSVPVSVGVLAGEAIVSSILSHHPDIKLDFRLEDRLINLAADNVDIALRMGADPPLSSEIVALQLTSWTRFVVASPSYLCRRVEPTSPLELSQHEALSIGSSPITDVWTLARGDEVARVRLESRFSTNAAQLLLTLALDGRGVALLPDWFVANDLKAKRLQRLLSEWATEPTVMYALYRASLRRDQRVKQVLAHLRTMFHGGAWPGAPTSLSQGASGPSKPPGKSKSTHA
jgi:DNA-binding transcriptional LysR family regulator